MATQERPSMKGTPQPVRTYIDDLEQQLAQYEADSVLARFYVRIVNKVEEIGTALGSFQINLDTISDSKDKTFDRFYKIWEKIPSLTSTLLDLEQKVNLIKAKNKRQEKEEVKKLEAGSPYEKELGL